MSAENNADLFTGGRGMRNSALTATKRDHDTAENKRKNHQDKLHEELNREARERLLENKVSFKRTFFRFFCK